jgi:hypothetical protein
VGANAGLYGSALLDQRRSLFNMLRHATPHNFARQALADHEVSTENQDSLLLSAANVRRRRLYELQPSPFDVIPTNGEI